MIPGGYIITPRLFYKSEAAHFPPCTRELWQYLLTHVNHADNGRYKRGQGFFQLADIQEALSWYVGYRKETYTKSQISKALRRLNEGTHGEPMTATVKATRGVVVTVCNYDHYQNPGNYEGNDEGATKATRRDLGGYTKNKNVKKKEDKKESKDYSAIAEGVVELWHTYATNLPRVKKITAKRITSIKTRTKDFPTFDDWAVYFQRINGSAFLTGETGWTCNFDWVLNETNMTKIIEGNYDNREKQSQPQETETQRMIRMAQEMEAQGATLRITEDS